MQLIMMLGIAVAIAAVAFALQNNVPVTVTFLFWRFDSSLAMVLLLALALGAIIVALMWTPSAIRSRWLLSRQRKEITTLKTANAELAEKLSAVERQDKKESAIGEQPRIS